MKPLKQFFVCCLLISGIQFTKAQCPTTVTITGNNKVHSNVAASTILNIGTCGIAGATVCAQSNVGLYSWAGSGLSSGYSVPSTTNQCFVTNLSDTYTLSVSSLGCPTLTRIVKTSNMPYPQLLGSNVQASCGSTLSVASLTAGGSLQPGSNYTLNWTPLPVSLSTNSLTGTYIAPPLSSLPIQVTVTAKDTMGCVAKFNFSVNPTIPLPTFTLLSTSGVSSITCNNSQVNLVALSNYTYGTLNINWVSPNVIASGTTASFSSPGTVSVTVHDISYVCATSQTYAIGVNQVPPTIGVITPSIQAITCSNPNVQTMTMTAANPTVNISHVVYSPVIGGSVTVSTASSAIYNPIPGSYTYALVNNLTGCSTYKTFTVSATNNFPTFGISSTPTLAGQGNYTVGCADHSLTVINIVNPNTSPVPGGALSFGYIAPGGGTVYTPTSSQSTVTSIPGTWTLIVKDDVTNCKATIPVVIVQNTIAPNISAIVPTQILNCTTPSATLTGLSTNPNVSFNWLPPLGGSIPNSSIIVAGITTNTASTSAGSYTLTSINNDNGCKSFSVIPMQQNLFPPIANISAISKTITCIVPTLQLTNASTTGIPPSSGFPNSGIISVQLWEGPVPSPTLSLQNSYIAAIPGTYSMTVKDTNNGCTSYTTITVQDGRIYPVINNPLFYLCTNTVVIFPISSTNPPYSYSWTPNSGILSVNVMTARSVTVNAVGFYHCVITNTVSACKTEGVIQVAVGCVGISEYKMQSSNLKTYPNPASSVLNVELDIFSEQHEVLIYNTLGAVIRNEKLNIENGKVEINVSELKGGIYFIKIGNRTGKFVKE